MERQSDFDSGEDLRLFETVQWHAHSGAPEFGLFELKTDQKACLSFAQQNEKKPKSTNLSLRTSNDKIACKQKNLQRFHIYHVEFSQWNLLTVGRKRVRVCSRERRGRRRRRRRRRLMHAVLRYILKGIQLT